MRWSDSALIGACLLYCTDFPPGCRLGFFVVLEMDVLIKASRLHAHFSKYTPKSTFSSTLQYDILLEND